MLFSKFPQPPQECISFCILSVMIKYWVTEYILEEHFYVLQTINIIIQFDVIILYLYTVIVFIEGDNMCLQSANSIDNSHAAS